MFIAFDRIVNVRDLGGIPAADGKKVRPGRLLRGAALDKASDADLERLREMTDRTVIVVTHNAAIAGMADRVIRLRDGAIRSNEKNAVKIPAAELEW